MNNTDSHQALYSQLADRIEAIHIAWVDASLKAFDKLQHTDPGLAQLVMKVWSTRPEAATYCASKIGDEHANGYALMAAGQRGVIVHALIAMKYGHVF